MYQPEIGDSLDRLDTPAVIVDLDLLEANLQRMVASLAGRVSLRPHLKTAKSLDLARILLQAGAIGGCVAKVSEAEVMAAGGIEDLLVTTEVIGPVKTARLAGLFLEHPRLKAVVDSRAGASDLQAALAAAGASQPMDIFLDINVGQNRTGLEPGPAVLELANYVAGLDSLRLTGLHGYEGHLQHLGDAEVRAARCRTAMADLAAVADELRAAGHSIEIVSTGGTGTAEICATCPGITEVQPGSFIFMDTDYRRALGQGYAHALTVLTGVISRPAERRVVVDAGLKSLSTDSGPAAARDFPHLRYRPGGDEHGILEWDSGRGPGLGERLHMLPSHIDTTINLHDFYYAVRAGRLEAIWPISTRGKVQ